MPHDDRVTCIVVEKKDRVLNTEIGHLPAREWCNYEAFDGALQRTGTQAMVVAFARQRRHQRFGPGESNASCRQTFAGRQFGKLFAHDGFHIRAAKGLECDDGIEPVEELGPEEL